ncbi:hypothetical protein [Thermaerobacillus caldiproteolyticus]|uniref:Uncharacterized protein n=1 Tax=Thermaerobacillus caldiproteolyticus TaxID=247480 RepID=A0A7V9Z5C1_9BACL|nr:hypothetical protein [Anoxybacillus caldiproteolyticus]MBA2874323.1 hypothetical protein [Anoxybacillus caldiproteolyticus]
MSIKIKMDGFDDLQKFFKNLEKKAKDASGKVSFPELFNPDFMTAFTKFKSIDEFFEKSPFDIKSKEDFRNLNESELDNYVKENTRFSSWKEMMNEAGKRYMAKKLGL